MGRVINTAPRGDKWGTSSRALHYGGNLLNRPTKQWRSLRKLRSATSPLLRRWWKVFGLLNWRLNG